jgi:hypothetical protein
MNQLGEVLQKGILESVNTTISTKELPAGTYLIKIGEQNKFNFKLMKK